MSAYRDGNYGELMSLLLHMRERFETDEQFQEFAQTEVRRFVTDVRALGIELTMRPTYGGQPLSQLSATKKLSQ